MLLFRYQSLEKECVACGVIYIKWLRDEGVCLSATRVNESWGKYPIRCEIHIHIVMLISCGLSGLGVMKQLNMKQDNDIKNVCCMSSVQHNKLMAAKTGINDKSRSCHCCRDGTVRWAGWL